MLWQIPEVAGSDAEMAGHFVRLSEIRPRLHVGARDGCGNKDSCTDDGGDRCSLIPHNLRVLFVPANLHPQSEMYNQ